MAMPGKLLLKKIWWRAPALEFGARASVHQVRPYCYRAPCCCCRKTDAGNCEGGAAIAAANTMFARVAEVKAGSCGRVAKQPFNRPAGLVPYLCPMLARKFKQESTQLLLDLYSNDKSLGLLDSVPTACGNALARNHTAEINRQSIQSLQQKDQQRHKDS